MPVTLKYRIIGLISKDADALFSISDIAKRLGVAYSHAHSFVVKLTKEDVLTIQKIGNVSVCRLNLKTPLTLSYLSVIESRKTLEWTKKNPHSKKIVGKIEDVRENVHCVLVKNNRIIIVTPEKIAGVDFTMFRNRTVITPRQLRSKRKLYSDCIILHGAEKYWGLLSG
ncbi:hypothetical protein KY362_00365 [Candidatus Woesearchaeota archaeon]|nr:hypothetical protein [Candidatus Woesearchaeota archaeon]